MLLSFYQCITDRDVLNIDGQNKCTEEWNKTNCKTLKLLRFLVTLHTYTTIYNAGDTTGHIFIFTMLVTEQGIFTYLQCW